MLLVGLFDEVLRPKPLDLAQPRFLDPHTLLAVDVTPAIKTSAG